MAGALFNDCICPFAKLVCAIAQASLFASTLKIGFSLFILRLKIRAGGYMYAPGTGTPEIGGFTTADALEIIRGLKDLDIVGYDVVEVAPQYDHGQITALAAANLMVEFMSHVAYHKAK